MISSATAASVVPLARPPRSEGRIPFACLVVFTFILFIAPQTTFPLLAGLNVAKLVMGLAILAHVGGRLVAGRPISEWLPETRLLIAFALLGTLSILWSLWPGGSYELLTDEFGKSVVLFFLFANVIDSARRLQVMIGSMLIWGVYIARTVMNDYLTGSVISGRVMGFDSPLAANPNDVALLLDLLIALGIGLYGSLRSVVGRLLVAAIVVYFAATVVATFSRGGFIGLVVIVAALTLKAVTRRRLGLVALIAILALGSMALPSGYGDRVASIFDFSRDESGSADARWTGMAAGLELMLKNPLGVGLGQNVLGLRDDGLAWGHVHSVYLQVGADLGVAGLAIFVAMVAYMLRGLHRSLRALAVVPGTGPLRALGDGVQIALVTYVLQGSVYPVAYNFYFYYVAGFAVAFQLIAGSALRSQVGSVNPA